MSSRVAGTDGSDHSYRQTIDDKYLVRASIKQSINQSNKQSKIYYVTAFISIFFGYFFNKDSLNQTFDLPIFILFCLSAALTQYVFRSINQSIKQTINPLVFQATVLTVILVWLTTVGLPAYHLLNDSKNQSVQQWGILVPHIIGQSVNLFGLYNVNRLNKLIHK